jgi:soluble lytic murein transglycosylase-like protein
LACTQFTPLKNVNFKGKKIIEEKDVNNEIITEIESKGQDLGLYYYTNLDSRIKVIDFYSSLTGSTEIALPILTYAHKYNVPISLAFALSKAESDFTPRAINMNASSVDRGLFQLNNLSFPKLKEEEFYNPWTNAKHGISYLRYCLNTGGNEVVALAMYNAGRGRVDSKGTPKMTLHYISRVLKFKENIEKDFKIQVIGDSKSTQTANIGRFQQILLFFNSLKENLVETNLKNLFVFG